MRLPFHGRFERANRFEREQRDLRDRAAGFGEDDAPCDMMEKGDGARYLGLGAATGLSGL